MPKVVLQGYILLPKANREQILQALDEHIDQSNNEQGCLVFAITPDCQNPDKYWVYEEFVDRQAFELHQTKVRESNWGVVSADVIRCYEPLQMVD